MITYYLLYLYFQANRVLVLWAFQTCGYRKHLCGIHLQLFSEYLWEQNQHQHKTHLHYLSKYFPSTPPLNHKAYHSECDSHSYRYSHYTLMLSHLHYTHYDYYTSSNSSYSSVLSSSWKSSGNSSTGSSSTLPS